MADYNAPFSPTLNPWTLIKQGAAGFVNTPADVTVGLAGVLGSDRAAHAHHSYTDTVDNMIGVQDPYWRSDPTSFIARQLGGALMGVPAKGLTLAANAVRNAPAAVRYTLRGLEAATPLTLPLNSANVAINAGVGSVLGAGMQSLGAVEAAAHENIVPPTDEEVIVPPVDAPVQNATSSDIIPPTDEEVIIPPVIEPRTVEEGPRTTAGTILQYGAPALALLGLGAGVRAGVKQTMAARGFDAASQDGLVQPGRTVNPEVEQLTVPNKLAQAMISDRTAAEKVLDDAVSSGKLTTQLADEVRGRFATQLSESPKNDIAQEAMRSGTLPLTNAQVRPRPEVETEVAALRKADPQSAALYQDALAASTELDTRVFNAAEKNWMPGQPGVPARVMLHDIDDAALQQVVSSAQANPVVARMLNEHNNDMHTLLDYMVQTGLKTPEDALRMGAANPNYVHTLYAEDRVQRNHSGNTVLTTGRSGNSPLSERTHQHEAGALRAQDPVIATNEAFRKVITMALENDARRSFVDAVMPHIRDMQLNNPTAPRLIKGHKVRPNDKTPAGWTDVSYYDKGERHVLQVAPPVAELLQTYPRTTVPLLSAMTRVFRNTTTGPAAAMLGSIQAPISASMAAMSSTVNRPKGTSAGLVDKGLQVVTGGRVGLRGDPTFALQTAYAGAADITAEASRGFASALRRAELYNSPLARVLGSAKLQQLASGAQQAYDRSVIAQMRREGSAGTGIAHDPEASANLSARNMALTPEYAVMAAKGQTQQGVGSLIDQAAQAGVHLTPVDAARTWRMFTTVLDIVSGSAASAYIRANQGRATSSKALHGLARRIAGDPAEIGASPAWQALASTVPYSNVTAQSVAAYVRGVRKHPLAAISGIAMASAVPQIVQLGSAILADESEMQNGGKPRHVAAVIMENSQGQTNNITVHIPGVDPAHGMRIVSDPTLAPVSAAVNSILINALGADSERFWTPEMASMRRVFTEFLSDRIASGMLAATGQALLQVSPPPILPLSTYLLSGADSSKMLDLTNSRIVVPRDRGAPGFTDNRLFNDPVDRHVEAILDTVFGVAGANAVDLARTAIIAMRAEPNRAGDAIVDAYKQNFASTARILPPGMQPERRITQRDAVGDALAPIEAGLERIQNGWGDVTRPGTVGSGNATQLPIGTGRPGVNQELLPVIGTAHAVYNATADMRAMRTALQQQLVSIESDPRWRNDPIAMRQRMNAETGRIRDLNRVIYSVVSEAELGLSLQYARRIRFDKVDPQRGLEQFVKSVD